MPEFTCRVGTPSGEVREEIHVSTDADTLRQELQRRDLHVFEIRTRGPGLKIGGLQIGGAARKVPRRQFHLFNQELVTLVRAGLPVLQCLEVLLERMPQSHFRRYLLDIRDRVRGGSSLSEAFQAQGEAFPRVYGAALTAGERSGELASVLARYVDFAKRTEQLRSKVTAALVYPALLTVLSVGLIILLMFYILPKFSTFYSEFEADLPMITVVVTAVARWLQAQGWLILGITVAAIVLDRAWAATDKGRLFHDRLLLRIPLFGQVVRMYNIAQFCRTLGTLLSGGIPLVSSLETTAGSLSNMAFIGAASDIADDVRQGQPLWESIERTDMMSDLTIEMVKVGETTGALDDMLTSVAEFYDDQVDDTMTRVVALFEPVLLIVMGVIVAFILLSMYLPIFRIAGTGV